ncbi:MAG TPA: LysM peptidoglycan-binding domain-containing M23 family metallopeptidase, partial [Hyphomicrobiaceae bacterium]|nr:LysM peptidoglycan-binding domain-containing M23 family metallopeptidase [Hyphomicrobiaceae bacterium]
VGPSRPFDAPKREAAPEPSRAAPAASGTTIEVVAGDTLYGLSKRHGVSVSSLMEVNGLKSAALKPGQKLALPSGARRPLERPAVAKAPPAAQVPAASAPTTASVETWTGTHTVKPGESLYAIARQHKIKLAELQAANTVTDPTRVRPGTVLKVPGEAGASASAVPAAPVAPTVAAAPEPPRTQAAATPPPTLPEPKSELVGGPGVKVINAAPTPAATAPASAATKVASLGNSVPAAKAGGATFAWPAKGPVIAEFGKRTDGSSNDGINISVPAGSDVHAAEAGTVAYAGSELKGYGNLVLVRHENGWVTAYAHADQVLVKRGDAVKRGQVIAKAGKTGSVDQPQVHFQLRRGSSPVDPMPHLEKN